MAVRIDDLKDWLSCPICFECYDRIKKIPKILPCMHTFCLECLYSINNLNNITIDCPICKRHCTLPTEGVRSIPSNFGYVDLLEMVNTRSTGKSTSYSTSAAVAIQNISSNSPAVASINSLNQIDNTLDNKQEIHQTITVCDECDDDDRTPALHYCLTCTRPLCEFHRQNHIKSKQTKLHPLVVLSSLNASKSVSNGNTVVKSDLLVQDLTNILSTDRDIRAAANLQFINCSIHETEQSTLFCQTCELSVCSQCVLPNHSSHSLHTIQTVYVLQRKTMSALRSQLLEHLTHHNELHNKIEVLQENINTKKSDLKNRILKTFAAFREALTIRENSLLGQLEYFSTGKLSGLADHSSMLLEGKSCLQNLCNTAAKLLSLGDDDSSGNSYNLDCDLLASLSLQQNVGGNGDPENGTTSAQPFNNQSFSSDSFISQYNGKPVANVNSLSIQAMLCRRLEEQLRTHRQIVSQPEERDDLAFRIEDENKLLHSLESLGELWEESASPARSTATGDGLENVRRGQRACFVIVARDSLGRALGATGSGEQLVVDIKPELQMEEKYSDDESKTHLPMIITVTDRSDGSYEVSYMLTAVVSESGNSTFPVHLGGNPQIGRCTISVLLRGHHICGSPFQVPLLDPSVPPPCTGQFVRSFGTTGSGDGQLSNARGLAIDSVNQQLFIADYNNNRLCVFRMQDGKFLRKFGKQGNGPGELSYCWSVVLEPRSGQLFVSDCGNHRICVFKASDGNFIRSFGMPGNGEGFLRFPEGLALDAVNSLLYVCDYSNHRISVFRSTDGSFVRTFGGQPHLQTPVGIAFGLYGEIFVTQYEVHRVAVFRASDGTFLRSFPSLSGKDDVLANPYGIVVDGEGNVLIGDYANKRIAMFRNDGTFTRSIGSEGLHKFEGPQGLALDEEGKLWVTDITTGKVVVFK